MPQGGVESMKFMGISLPGTADVIVVVVYVQWSVNIFQHQLECSAYSHELNWIWTASSTANHLWLFLFLELAFGNLFTNIIFTLPILRCCMSTLTSHQHSVFLLLSAAFSRQRAVCERSELWMQFVFVSNAEVARVCLSLCISQLKQQFAACALAVTILNSGFVSSARSSLSCPCLGHTSCCNCLVGPCFSLTFIYRLSKSDRRDNGSISDTNQQSRKQVARCLNKVCI